MIDYAYPCMMAEKALKNAHEKVLDNDLDGAIAEALNAMAESKLLFNALRYMQQVKEGKWNVPNVEQRQWLFVVSAGWKPV